MDSEAIRTTTTTTTAPTSLPVRLDTVVVFGDSLSDIGKKWTTKSGKAARLAREMFVSPTGRFSDCRNWTDFMFEAATGSTMVVDTAESTIALSKRHTSFKRENVVLADDRKRFRYANYAEGGACGDTPASKRPFLGTFKEQVDAFENDCKVSQLALGNTLFIIWFGANDLYTAGRKAVEMAQVAEQIASTQRRRLALIHKQQNQRGLGTRLALAAGYRCKFVFVDLCRPLSSVRYTKRLQDAEAKVRAQLGAKYLAPTGRVGGVSRAHDTLIQGIKLGFQPGKTRYNTDNQMELLRAQVAAIKELENGVLLFNATLKKIAHQNGDRVAEVSWCVSEDTVLKLVQGNYRLQAGAMEGSVWTHIPANEYYKETAVQHITTIDEVHPTDQMYRLLWLEIYEQIKRSGCTFGKLRPDITDTPLAGLAGPSQPSQETRQGYGAVMDELLRRRRPIG
jgi:hypothetical protein